MKTAKGIIVIISRIVGLLVILLVIIAIVFYMTCPVYNFDEPETFNGNKLFNPYDNIDTAVWKKSNFHCHTKASDGLNTVGEIMNAYSKYGYEIIAVSDHSTITKTDVIPSEYIPVYEHGINISLYHFVLIGAVKASIYDYPLVNNLSHKYNIIKLLGINNDIVAFAHPDKTRWLETEDMKYISGYTMMEASLGNGDGSLPFYDAALSSGHYSYVIAGDDCHDLNSSRHFGRAATFVNSVTKRFDDVRDALHAGRNFAVMLPDFKDPDYKLRRNLNLPVLRSLKLIDDSIFFSISEPASINVYGQGGEMIYSFKDCGNATVPFRDNDTYLRFTAVFNDGAVMYTNPVIRTAGGNIRRQDLVSVNYPMTFVQTLILTTASVVLVRQFLLIILSLLPERLVNLIYKFRILVTRRDEKKIAEA
jgi:hypothetical protein